MSTRSRLRMVLDTGETKAIYCHSDGYPSHQMPILTEYYNTVEKVRELMALGNISYLAKRVKPNEDEPHSFKNPHCDKNGDYDIVIAYHRDRGEPLNWWENKQEYNYIFNGHEWKLEHRIV